MKRARDGVIRLSDLRRYIPKDTKRQSLAHSFVSREDLGIDTKPLRDAQLLREVAMAQNKLTQNNIADAQFLLEEMKHAIHLFPPVI